MPKQHSLVVGGTRGIGRTIVNTLAQENHTVSAVGRRPPSATQDRVPNVDYWVVDLLDRDTLNTAWLEILSQNGKIRNLIFSQRYRGEGDDWTGEIELSLTATKTVIEQLADHFDENRQGSIVIISSIAGAFIAEEQPVSYHVAKAGLNQMVRYYAVALGSKGVRVNSISSGAVLKEESQQYYRENKRLHELYCSITPLGRMVTSQDIADVTTFLCSSKASYITGQNIVVDGGLSLQWHQSFARHLLDI